MHYVSIAITIIIGILSIYFSQRNATVLESPEIHTYIECQTEGRNDPHTSRDSNSVERRPGYTFSENISIDTGQRESSTSMGEFITSALEDVTALEAHHSKVTRLVEGVNSGVQDARVKLAEITAGIENKH